MNVEGTILSSSLLLMTSAPSSSHRLKKMVVVDILILFKNGGYKQALKRERLKLETKRPLFLVKVTKTNINSLNIFNNL